MMLRYIVPFSLKQVSSKALRLLFVVCILLLLSNCVNIKSTYVSPQYYTLSQQPLDTVAINFAPKNLSLFVKEFDINSDLETSKIAVFEDGISIKYYNYHQWTSTLNEVLTEHSITRLSKYGLFGKGIAQSIYSATPDLMLECKVLTCAINHYKNSNKPSNVELSIYVTLLTADKASLTYTPVFVKTYNKTSECNDDSLRSSIETLGTTLSAMVDMWLLDILKQI